MKLKLELKNLYELIQSTSQYINTLRKDKKVKRCIGTHICIYLCVSVYKLTEYLGNVLKPLQSRTSFQCKTFYSVKSYIYFLKY